VTLRNDGLQDVPQATLELWAAPAQGQATRVATQQVALLAHTPLTVTIQWAPPSVGRWTITPVVIQPDGRRTTFNASEVTVVPATSVNPEILFSSSTSPVTLPVAAIALVTFATIAALSVWRQWTIPVDGPGE
jgi:hypothetical protein